MPWLGYQEILLIAVVALLMLGPHRLPEFFRNAGRISARLRRYTIEFQREWDNMIHTEDPVDLEEARRLRESLPPKPAAWEREKKDE